MLDSTEKCKGSLLINLHSGSIHGTLMSPLCCMQKEGQRNEKPRSSFQLVQVGAKAALENWAPDYRRKKELSRDLLNNDIGFEQLPGKHSMEWFLHSVWLHSQIYPSSREHDSPATLNFVHVHTRRATYPCSSYSLTVLSHPRNGAGFTGLGDSSQPHIKLSVFPSCLKKWGKAAAVWLLVLQNTRGRERIHNF